MGFKVQLSGNNKIKVDLNSEPTRAEVSVKDSDEINVDIVSESTSTDIDSKSAVFIQGDDGATFFPQVSLDGNLSWTNNKGFENPPVVNIMGPQGT